MTTKLLSGAAATFFGVWLLIQSVGLFFGGSDYHRLQTALRNLDPGRIETVAPVVDAFGRAQVELSRENIDAAVKATLALREELNIDMRFYSNLKRAKQFGAAVGKSLAKDRERIPAVAAAAGFDSEEQYFMTLGTIAALYPATVMGDSEKEINERLAGVPAALDKIKTASPALSKQLGRLQRLIEGYASFAMARPDNIRMVLANKGKIELAIGKLDEGIVKKFGTRAIMDGGIN
jgi:hypothetical protein